MFLAPKFFWGNAPPPEFLEWDYKIQPDSDHVAKFKGDRSRDLGETVAKKRYITGKTEALPSGGLKTFQCATQKAKHIAD